jgi:hypothetical protein
MGTCRGSGRGDRTSESRCAASPSESASMIPRSGPSGAEGRRTVSAARSRCRLGPGAAICPHWHVRVAAASGPQTAGSWSSESSRPRDAYAATTTQPISHCVNVGRSAGSRSSGSRDACSPLSRRTRSGPGRCTGLASLQDQRASDVMAARSAGPSAPAAHDAHAAGPGAQLPGPLDRRPAGQRMGRHGLFRVPSESVSSESRVSRCMMPRRYG